MLGSGIDEGLLVAVGFIIVAVGIVIVAAIPGLIAKSRGHANATAIAVCGVVGILTFGVFWLVALVWAFTGPDNSRPAPRAGGGGSFRSGQVCNCCGKPVLSRHIPYGEQTFRCPACGALNSLQ